LQHTCELEAGGTVVHPSEVARLLPDVDIERIVFASPSRVIDVSVRQRLYTGALRRAIEVRDRHCTHPGCDVPAHQCHIDHIIEYAKGGLTTQANGRLRCPKHNRDRNTNTQRPPPTNTT
jgi:Rieske Fe-S protein